MFNKIIMKMFLVFSGLILLSALSEAQPTGYTSYLGQGLNSATLVDLNIVFRDQVIFAVSGDSGSVFESTNLGETWENLDALGYILGVMTKDNKPDTSVFSYKSRIPKKEGALNTLTDSLWAVGRMGAIIFSSNSGANWIQQTSGLSGDIYAGYFTDNHYGWAADLANHVIHTTNAGANWTTISSLSFQPYTIYFYDHLNGWAGGFHGKVNYTSDGGITWVDRTPPNRNTLAMVRRIQFVNQNTGWWAGTNFSTYSLFRTTNGGVQWDSCALNPAPQNLYGLSFVNALTGYVCGENHIYKTTNGGVNWISQTLPANTPWLYDIQFANPDTGIAVGQNATILYTTSGGAPIGITPISSEVPKGFALSQNYPNPFNPSTNINFAVPKQALVKLVVYDIAGREIETLVNEELKAGTYKADWNAVNYPSGVYFYKLETEMFTETKKMILLK